MNYNQIMLDYLKTYSPLDRFLKFNSTQNEQDETGMNPVVGRESYIKMYTSGNTLKEYAFAIVMYKSFDTGYSNTNIEEMYDVQKFMNWIDEQNRNKNYPLINGVNKIENLQNMPNLAGVEENTIAKYMFQCKVTYVEERVK